MPKWHVFFSNYDCFVFSNYDSFRITIVVKRYWAKALLG